jgi:hypothetical protein
VGKVVHPCRVNLFEKPCSRLRTTWRQILDHRQIKLALKSVRLRVRLRFASSVDREGEVSRLVDGMDVRWMTMII